MQPPGSLREQFMRKIVAWAADAADIQALILVGSGAREDTPADAWSDIDLVMLVDDLARYLGSTAWFDELDPPWVGTVERGPAGQIVERRVLFRSGIDVDFIVLAKDSQRELEAEPLKSILARGAKILLDKEGILTGIRLEAAPEPQPHTPTAAEFKEVVNDFWFHAVWTAKKLRRGELWTAKSCCDVYMKRLLLKMIEWHTLAAGQTVAGVWYNGRFIERWARADVVARLEGVFAHYDEVDIWRALQETMRLFDEIARETAQKLVVAYTEKEAREIAAWVKTKCSPSFFPGTLA